MDVQWFSLTLALCGLVWYTTALSNVKLLHWILQHGKDIQALQQNDFSTFADSKYPDDKIIDIKPNGTDVDDIIALVDEFVARGMPPSTSKNGTSSKLSDYEADTNDGKDAASDSKKYADPTGILTLLGKFADDLNTDEAEGPIAENVAARDDLLEANSDDLNDGVRFEKRSSNAEDVDVSNLSDEVTGEYLDPVGDSKAPDIDYEKLERLAAKKINGEDVTDELPPNNCTMINTNEYRCRYTSSDKINQDDLPINCKMVAKNEYHCNYRTSEEDVDISKQLENCTLVGDNEYHCHYIHHDYLTENCTFVNEMEYHCHYTLPDEISPDELSDNCKMVNKNEYHCHYTFTDDTNPDVKDQTEHTVEREHHYQHLNYIRRYHHHHFHHHYHHHHTHHYHHHYHHHHRIHHHHYHHHHHRMHHHHHHHHRIHHHHHHHHRIHHHHHHRIHHHHFHHHHHYHHHHYRHHHTHHYHHHRIHHHHHHHFHHHHHHRIHHHHHFHHHHHRRIHHHHHHHFHHHYHHHHHHHHYRPSIHRGRLYRSCHCNIDVCNCCINQVFRINFHTRILRFRLNACLGVRRVHQSRRYSVTFTINNHRLWSRTVSLRHYHRQYYNYGPTQTCLNINKNHHNICGRITGRITLGGVAIRLNMRIGCFGIPYLSLSDKAEDNNIDDTVNSTTFDDDNDNFITQTVGEPADPNPMTSESDHFSLDDVRQQMKESEDEPMPENESLGAEMRPSMLTLLVQARNKVDHDQSVPLYLKPLFKRADQPMLDANRQSMVTHTATKQIVTEPDGPIDVRSFDHDMVPQEQIPLKANEDLGVYDASSFSENTDAEQDNRLIPELFVPLKQDAERLPAEFDKDTGNLGALFRKLRQI